MLVVDPRGRNHPQRGKVLAFAAGAALVAAGVAAQPFCLDDPLATPHAPRGVEMAEAGQVRGADHHPARRAAHGDTADFIGRVKIGVGIWNGRIQILVVADVSTGQPIPARPRDPDPVEQALLQHVHEIPAPHRRKRLAQAPEAGAAVVADRARLDMGVEIVERIAGPVGPLDDPRLRIGLF